MIESVSSSERIAAPWPLANRGRDRVGQTATAILRWAVRVCGLGDNPPALQVSREWLDEHERHSRKHPGDP